MYPLTIAIAIGAKELSEEVRAALNELPVRTVIEHQDVSDLAPFLDRMERMRPDVVLVDIGGLTEKLDDLVRKLRGIEPDCMIVAMHTSADPETILSAVRAGANEYLYPPCQANLRRALERKSAERTRKRDVAGGKNIAFFSAKGGCGATTLACHIGAELGRQNQRVLLADLDMEAGMIGFLMKTKSAYSVLDALNNLHRLDMSFWKGLVSNGIPGVEIIPAPAALAFKQQGGKQEHFRHILGFVRSNYDWTIVDLGRSLNHISLATLDEIDEAYLVATLDVPALHQAKQLVQILLDRGYGKNRLRLILNRAPKQLDITAEELEKMLGIRIYAMLPDSFPELYEAYSEGKLLGRSSNLGKHIERLAAKLSGIEESKPKGKLKLFG